MARNYSNLASSRTEYARALPGVEGGFRGVDFSSSPHKVALFRLSDVQNMYRDYRSEEGGALESIPGFRRLHKLEGRIHGLYRYDTGEGVTYVAAHAGEGLYLCREDKRDGGAWVKAKGTLADAPSRAFVYNNTLYLLDGKSYQRVVEQDGAFELISVMSAPYIPKSFNMGEQYEQRNLLTDRYIVCDIGSAGVEAVMSASDQYSSGSDAKYVGDDSFVYSYMMSTSYYKGTNARAVFFGNGPNGINIIGVGGGLDDVDDSIHTIGIAAETETITISGGAFKGYEALKNCYLSANVNKGYKLEMPEEGKLVMKQGGRLYFNSALNALPGMFENYENAFLWLPPNVVVRQGGTYQTGDELRLATPDDGGVIMGANYSRNIWIHGNVPDNFDAEKIYVHNGADGRIAVTAGANVSPGRYYFHGRVKNEKGVFVHRMFRIEVAPSTAADDEIPLPVQDVYEFSAVPRIFHLPEKTEEVLSVKDETYDAGFGCQRDADGNIKAICAMVRAGENEITVEAVATDYHIKTTSRSFFDANPDYKGTSEEAINGCTLCAIYDDRVFLAGNPALPNTVFYSARNDVGVSDPSYFGVLNYFNDGIGWEKITALFPFSDTLCVTKADTVYYHQGADGSDYVPRVYPSVRGNAGLGSLGACCNFLDDPVMLTEKGVFGINKETLTLERTLGRRSATVDARLLREDKLGGAEMVEWEGYLCLFVNGHVYMADSRAVYEDVTGSMQYEWFYLADVGVWRDDTGLPTPVYAAVTGDLLQGDISLDGELVTRNGASYPLTQTHEELLFTDAYSATVKGIDILYAVEGEKAYVVYATGELAKEGVFHPGEHPLVVGDRLYFGADTGEVFVFNNDKRGESVEGDEVAPTELHPTFYSFAGHRIDSGFLTNRDNCGIPHLCKSTSSASLVFRTKLLPGAEFVVAVTTEKKRNKSSEHIAISQEKISSSSFCFGRVDFSTLSFYTESSAVVVAREHERRWVEKQYLLRDGGYCRPFGIYEITYRYRIAGRIRE